MTEIGITERGDAALNTKWVKYLDMPPWHAAILITKDPVKLLSFIKEKCTIDQQKRIIIHATITGYGGTPIESGVPNSFSEEYKSKLVSLLNEVNIAKKVLRVDPVLPTDKGTFVACDVIKMYQDYFDEIRISFIDNYYHIKARGIELPWDSLHAPLEIRQESYNEIFKYCSKPLKICGEPGFPCSGCVSEDDLKAVHLFNPADTIEVGNQRKFCSCLAGKTELLDNKHPCAHNCLYCYWKDENV